MNKNSIIIGVVAIVLMGATAAIASYVTRESMQPNSVTAESQMPSKKPSELPASQQVHSAQKSQPAKPRCNDKNIVGTVAGGAAGGLLGSQIGHGGGKTAAIIGGVAGGALLGNQYIPTRNVTCQD